MTIPPSRVGALCSVARVLAQIDSPTNRAFIAAIADGTDAGHTPAFRASQALLALGIDLPTANLRRHRRRLTLTGEHCRCPAPEPTA